MAPPGSQHRGRSRRTKGPILQPGRSTPPPELASEADTQGRYSRVVVWTERRCSLRRVGPLGYCFVSRERALVWQRWVSGAQGPPASAPPPRQRRGLRSTRLIVSGDGSPPRPQRVSRIEGKRHFFFYRLIVFILHFYSTRSSYLKLFKCAGMTLIESGVI